LEGLYIIEDFITENEEQELIRAIDSRSWCGNDAHNITVMNLAIDTAQNLGPLPTFTDFIINRFKQQKIIDFDDEPNMCIINEYEAGQGIMPHTDAATIFGPIILSLSLLSSSPRSLLIMTKSSRYDYKHSISKDIIEWYDDDKNDNKLEIVRSRRVSLTFRTVHHSGLND
ncbi:6240_t:CDS:2, partial [Scutellospora calospora]